MFEMSDKTLVVQHNKLIEARYKLSVEEQRLIKTLVSQIQVTDDDFKSYEVRILDLANLVGITNDYYYNKIKILTKKLRDCSLSFTNENGDEVQTGWLSSAIYRKGKGIVELRFDPVLKPYLLQLKSFFTSYELGNILRLKGMYSIRIYELLKQYEKIGKRELSLQDFKKLLHIENQYKQYKELKKYVLNPARLEIFDKTDISFSLEEKTQGRKVIGLIFYISSKKRPELENEISENTVEVVNKEIEKYDNVQVTDLVNMGVTVIIAKQLVSEFDKERIERAIAYTKEKEKNGSVKDSAAFVVTAIQKDFTDAVAKKKENEEKIHQAELKQENLKRQWENIKNQYEEWKKEAAKLSLLEMPIEEITSHKQQFLDSLAGNTVILNAIKKNKETENRHFSMYLRKTLALDTLEIWAGKNNIDLSIFPASIRQ